MLLYHGSLNKFNKFSLEFKGLNGRSEGEGVYLTTSKTIAYGGYAGEEGYTYTVRLHEGKELSNYEVTLSPDEVIQIIEYVGAYDILNNYEDVDYYGMEYVKEIALDTIFRYNDDDNGIISDLYTVSGKDNRVLEAVANLGYTHATIEASWGYEIEPHTIYVVYDLNALEILEIEEGKEVIL